MNSVNFDSFIELKNKKGVGVFIILLDNEHPYLNDKGHWIWHVSFDIHVVRLSQEEFSMLDIGIHPKVIFTKDSKEVYFHNGIMSYDQIKKVLYESCVR